MNLEVVEICWSCCHAIANLLAAYQIRFAWYTALYTARCCRAKMCVLQRDTFPVLFLRISMISIGIIQWTPEAPQQQVQKIYGSQMESWYDKLVSQTAKAFQDNLDLNRRPSLRMFEEDVCELQAIHRGAASASQKWSRCAREDLQHCQVDDLAVADLFDKRHNFLPCG